MEYVIIDIETTGLDRECSSIIEVGAVLIKDNKIHKTYQSFVKYTKALPYDIKKITGITEEMVKDAPEIKSVIVELKNFIGDLPVVSHNGFSFDFPILEREGLKIKNKYDSLEFSFFVLPANVNGHSASALCQQFNLREAPHRALEDCKILFELIQKLQEEYKKRPIRNREALKYLAEQTRWWWLNFLAGKSNKVDHISYLIPKFKSYRKKDNSQEIIAFQTEKIDLEDVEKAFLSAGKLSEKNDDMDYSENRPEQKKMALIIAAAFNDKKHVVIEAGTGTGKSKAYLVPSLIFALKNRIPLVISTHTKTLQDQLFSKEIPHLREIINSDFIATMLKGKKNYVCLEKFDELTDEVLKEMSQRSLYEVGLSGTNYTTPLAHLLIASWILETDRGDWDELPFWFKERIAKRIESDICNIDELCYKGTCNLYEEQKCFYAKARLRARDADLIVVNHALTLTGITVDDETEMSDSGNMGFDEVSQNKYSHTVFPGEAKFIVLDEAHHLEDDATSVFEKTISDKKLFLELRQVYGKRGVGKIIEAILKNKSNDERIRSFVQKFKSLESDTIILVKSVFEDILPKIIPKKNNEEFSSYVMLNDIPDDSDSRKILIDSLKNIGSRFDTLEGILKKLSAEADSSRNMKILQVRADSINRCLKSFSAILDDGEFYVKYLERSGDNIEIKAVPISVAEILKDFVYDNFLSVIMTSATLSVNKSFRFFASRCGTDLIDKEKIEYSFLPSSFNFEKQVKFFVPRGISYSQDTEKHFEKSIEFLKNAILASQGGSLILCSSHKQVGRIYDNLLKPLSENNIWLLRQSKKMSVSSVVTAFKKDINSVLVGTETLWQGIDVPGESLRSLFIYKIPYRMPSLPIVVARRKKLDKQGIDSFAAYYEPLATLALKQGFGRLIRKSTDTGVAILLDENLLDKPQILNSMPPGVFPKKEDPEKIFNCLGDLSKNAKN